MFATTFRTVRERMFRSKTFVTGRSFSSSTSKKISEWLNTVIPDETRHIMAIKILAFQASLYPTYCLVKWICYPATIPAPKSTPAPVIKAQSEVNDDFPDSENFAEFISSDENLEKLLSDENLEKFLRNI
jgi:hypothetical protein